MCRARAGVSLLVVAGALGASARPASPQSGGTALLGAHDTLTGRRLRPEITALVIQGAHAVPKHEIENGIVTAASHCRGVLLTPFCLVSRAPYLYQRVYLDRDELKRDVLRIRVLYWRHGYRLTSVDTAVTPPGAAAVRVTLRIHEGPPTLATSVTVTPDTLFNPRVQRRIVLVHRGRPLDLYKLDTTARSLRDHLRSQGFGDATVDTTVQVVGQPPPDSANRAAAAAGRLAAGTATVGVRMNPRRRTTVDTVLVTGNVHVSAQTIRHAIPLRPHSLFLPSDVSRSQRALIATNLFRNATVTVDTTAGKPDSAKAITVNVTEAPAREASAGVGFTTADFFSVSSRFADYNWVGGGRRLVLSGALGNLFAHGLYSAFNNGYKEIPPDISPAPYLSPTWAVSADVQQPWFGGAENSLGFGVFAHRRVAPGVYVDNAYGATPSFTHDVASRASISVSYRFEQTHVQAGDAYFCVDYGVCDAATRAALQTHARLSPLILTAQVDRSNDPLNPTAGFVARAEVQHGSQITASNFHYNRAYINASAYRPWGRSVIALNARAGVVGAIGGTGAAIGDTSGNVLHPTVRFYAGGSQSVRGFGENQLGPRVLTIPPNVLRGTPALGPAHGCSVTTPIQQCPVNVPYLRDADFAAQPLGGRTLLEGSVELRYPIYKQLGGAVFVDAGIVGQGNLANATSGTSAVTPGFGFRYYSIVGPIRIDLGLNPLTTYHLVVLTETPDRRIVVVTGPPGTGTSAAERVYAPARSESGWQAVLNRLSLHLSIGQAF
jgi:outer membrane protein assembly factor BamA